MHSEFHSKLSQNSLRSFIGFLRKFPSGILTKFFRLGYCMDFFLETLPRHITCLSHKLILNFEYQNSLKFSQHSNLNVLQEFLQWFSHPRWKSLNNLSAIVSDFFLKNQYFDRNLHWNVAGIYLRKIALRIFLDVLSKIQLQLT